MRRLPGGMRSAAGCYGTGVARYAAAFSGRNRLRYSFQVQTIREVADGQGTRPVEVSSARGTEQVSDGKIEITLPDGTSIKVGHDIGLTTLRRVLTVLRR